MVPKSRTPNLVSIRSIADRQRSGAHSDIYFMELVQISAPHLPSGAHTWTPKVHIFSPNTCPNVPQTPLIAGGGAENELNLELRHATMLAKAQVQSLDDGRVGVFPKTVKIARSSTRWACSQCQPSNGLPGRPYSQFMSLYPLWGRAWVLNCLISCTADRFLLCCFSQGLDSPVVEVSTRGLRPCSVHGPS